MTISRPSWLSEEHLAWIIERDGESCVECRRLGLETPPDEPLEIDHKQPRSKGGTNHWTNLQILCRGHNRSRADRPLRGARRPPWARRR